MSFPGLPEGLLRGAVRETAKATAALVARKIAVPQTIGATVTNVDAPGNGRVTVHLDGDPVGQSVPVACGWDLYQVGQRVLVHLYPPNGAYVLGPADGPVPWIDYPFGVDAWTSQQHKTPTLTDLSAFGQEWAFPGDVSSYQLPSVTLAAGRLIVVPIGGISHTSGGGNGAWEFTGITNSGVPLEWERVVQRQAVSTNSDDTFPPAYSPADFTVAIFRAWSHVAQTVSLTAHFSKVIKPSPLLWNVISCADAAPIQAGAAAASNIDTQPNPSTVPVTTVVDRSQVVGIAMGTNATPVSSTALWNVAAATDCTLLARYPALGDEEFRGGGIVRRTSGVTTPGATTVGITGTPTITTGRNVRFVVAGMEIIGVPDLPVIGDGQLAASYKVDGKHMTLGVSVAAGPTTTWGNGPIVLQLPPGFRASPRKPIQSIGGMLLPTGDGGNMHRLQAFIRAGETAFYRTAYQDASSQALTGSNPVSLGSSTLLSWDGTIEIA